MAATRTGLAERVASSAVEVAKPKAPDIYKMIEGQVKEVERALPTHLKGNADAYCRSAVTLIKQTPALATVDPRTILGGLMTASQLGLELGPLQVAYLVPKAGKAQFWIGYRGYIELGYRSGVLTDITAETVKDADDFSFDRAKGEISHQWDPRKPRGSAYAWYAIAHFLNGGQAFVVLGREDVEWFRKFSAQPNGPMWKDHYDSAAKKTAIRRLEPYLPKSANLSRAFILDGSVTTGLTADTLEVEMESDYIDVEALDDVDLDTGEIAESADGAMFEQES